MRLPDFDTLRASGPECPSDFALDRFVAGELKKEDAAKLEAHAAGCELCTNRLEEGRAGFDAIPQIDPRRMLARIRAGASDPARDSAGERVMSWLRRLLAPMALAGAAAALFLVARKPAEITTTRLKGGPVLHVYRQVGDHSEEAISGARFQRGDRLRFAVDLPAAGALRIVGVEASGTLYTAWPMEQGTRSEQKAGVGVELPGAVELDATVGRETLYAVLCTSAGDLAQCRSQGPATAPSCPAGCAMTPFTLEKE
jgi:hypothetical protein